MESLGDRPWSQEMGAGFGRGGSPYSCYRALVTLLQGACQVPGSEERRRRAFPRLRPFAGLGTSLCVPLK